VHFTKRFQACVDAGSVGGVQEGGGGVYFTEWFVLMQDLAEAITDDADGDADWSNVDAEAMDMRTPTKSGKGRSIGAVEKPLFPENMIVQSNFDKRDRFEGESQ
jgi:hypothetical protein